MKKIIILNLSENPKGKTNIPFRLSVNKHKLRSLANNTPDPSYLRKWSYTPVISTATQDSSRKWYLRGHKFKAIHIFKKPRVIPQIHLSGTSSNRLSRPGASLSSVKKKKKPHIFHDNNYGISVCVKLIPKTLRFCKKNSSKLMQVDSEELDSNN